MLTAAKKMEKLIDIYAMSVGVDEIEADRYGDLHNFLMESWPAYKLATEKREANTLCKFPGIITSHKLVAEFEKSEIGEERCK